MTARAVKRYFVVNLSRDERPEPHLRYQIQILNGVNESIEEVYATGEEAKVEFGRFLVPREVIEAAIRQREGKGDYVNKLGESIPPF
jgi:hypothetical protein